MITAIGIVICVACAAPGASPEPPEIPAQAPPPQPSTPSPVQSVQPYDGCIIDAHSQCCPENMDTIIQWMDQAGVAFTILSAGVTSPKGIVTPEEMVSFSSGYPGRIIPAVRTKGREYVRNEQGYYELLKTQADMEQFGAIAEVLMYHAQKGGRTRQAPEIVVYPDDRRVQAALDYALVKGWPFVVHIEFAAAGTRRDTFMTGLEELLVRYPEHPFVLIHMGQLEHTAVRQLIETYPNIYFITSHSNPITVQKSRQPWTNLFDGATLSADWEQVIVQYPDRFVLGFDMVWADDWGHFYLDTVATWREAIKVLPSEVARLFACGNAECLWRLPSYK